jgi:hypothetical protein
MCSYQTLFHDDNAGYVVRCNECENIQIGFGNLVLTVNDLASFLSWLKEIRNGQPGNLKETIRCITVPTPCERIKFMLSLRELREFIGMLEEADTELRSFCLLKLFSDC